MDTKELPITNTPYFVNNLGQIITYNWRNTGRQAILKPARDKKGYLRVGLMINGKLVTRKVHRLVAAAFIDNPENKPQVNHIDGDKANNNSRNLEWVTQEENKKHSFKIGLENNNGSNNPFSKLTELDVMQMRVMAENGDSLTHIKEVYNIHISTVRRIINRKTWTHI